jgi:hypothetical protein
VTGGLLSRLVLAVVVAVVVGLVRTDVTFSPMAPPVPPAPPTQTLTVTGQGLTVVGPK